MGIRLVVVKFSNGIDLVTLAPAGVASSLDFRSSSGGRSLDKQAKQFAHSGESGPTLQ